MRLDFQERHLSIIAFPEIEIPSLTIITGVNGSGKTHLLQAIQRGAIGNSVVQLRQNPAAQHESLFIGQGGPTIQFGQPYMSQMGNHPAPHTMMSVEHTRQSMLNAHYSDLMDAVGGRLTDFLSSKEEVWALNPSELASRAGVAASAISAIYEAAESTYRRDANPAAVQHRGSQFAQDAAVRQRVIQVADKLGIKAIAVTGTQLKMFEPWGTIELFSANLPMLFGKYRDAYVRNSLLQREDEKTGSTKSISDEEFTVTFGSPPWISINETISAFSLPYHVMEPDLFDFTPVDFSLIRNDTKEPVHFSNLSSGEKVLLQFAISTYSYDEQLTNVVRPKLLLLDEMDAALHPHMVHRWLTAIQYGLVEQQGMHCILTTHSPTTVALAPEEALYQMTDGRTGLTKISKQDALNRLTFGVPTLSINYSGRRQVFTESDTDAAIYESVYALIKSHIRCDRELNFLSTGLRDKDNGEINAGCTIVKQTVGRLAELGNTSIFGIVDWDGEAVSTNRIKVVAGGERNGIENVLLDPLLIALLLMKERRLPQGLEDISHFAGAERLSKPDIQRLIDAIQRPLFDEAEEYVEVDYLGGAKACIFRSYLEADDHALEEGLCEHFDGLRKWHPKGKGRGTLVKAVVEHVLSEHVGFCPTPLRSVFEAVANAAD